MKRNVMVSVTATAVFLSDGRARACRGLRHHAR